jgi:hypothetical protein
VLDRHINQNQASAELRYSFNLGSGRFDVQVMEAYRDVKALRHTRDRLIEQVRGGQLDHLLLKRLPGLEHLSAAANIKAATNIIDYHFEPHVLPSMASGQLANYFQACQKTLRMRPMDGVDFEGPLWIDTVHHVCVFSVIYEFSAYLAQRRGYRKLILLHQGKRAEPRLQLFGKLIHERHGMECTFIAFSGGWFSSLSERAAPDSVIFYLIDMPQETSQRSAPRKRQPVLLRLHAEPDISIAVETLSGSKTFAGRLGAAHAVLDYPAKDEVQVRPYDDANSSARCPLEDWVFWPLLRVIETAGF